MPSSTFNFDSASRVPTLKWSRVWIGTCFLVITTVLSSEAFWRANGHRPSIVDDPSLWSYHRRQISDQRSQVVLLGASRILLGFSTKTFRDRFPTTPIAVLAIDGAMPIAVLRDLAEDESFRGIVICATTAGGLSSSSWEQQQEYVDHFYKSGPNQLLEPVLRSWLQNRLVVLNPNVRLIRTIGIRLRDGHFPEPMYLVTKFDRSRLADYSLLNIEEHRRKRIERVRSGADHHPSFESWSKDATTIGSLVHGIKARGGIVVFVRFPTCDEHWEIDENVYPKRVYWDQLAYLTGAKTIHFRDVPSLAHFDCPDTSHLDYRDSPKFTAALLDELLKQRILSEDQNR